MTGVQAGVKVRRATKLSWAGVGLVVPAVVVMAMLPYLIGRGSEQDLVTLFGLIVIATMWNFMAGYAGLVSFGQQAYIGLGAYGLVYFADIVGINPFLAVPIAMVVAGVISIPVSFVIFRLSGGYFAIGTLVIAEIASLIFSGIGTLGAGSGITLHALDRFAPALRIAYVYWMALIVLVLSVAVTYLLMRSRLGLGFTAIRDDTTAAASLGVEVMRSKRIVYVIACVGMALAGSLIAANTLRVDPSSATGMFSIQYSADALFIVLIGGLGTIEGPIIGAVVFWVLQQQFASLGTWYMVILACVAIFVVLFLPGGIWGLISGRGRLKLFPIGYRLVPPK
jgi:branched-chain amino acid transport system permease protein